MCRIDTHTMHAKLSKKPILRTKIPKSRKNKLLKIFKSLKSKVRKNRGKTLRRKKIKGGVGWLSSAASKAASAGTFAATQGARAAATTGKFAARAAATQGAKVGNFAATQFEQKCLSQGKHGMRFITEEEFQEQALKAEKETSEKNRRELEETIKEAQQRLLEAKANAAQKQSAPAAAQQPATTE